MEKLTGVVPIVAMPFKEDRSLDLASLSKQVEHLISAGASGIGTGIASEVFFLTDEERATVTQTIGAAAAGAVPHVASAGGDSSEIARDRAARAAESGADLLMLLPPSFTALSVEALTEYVEKVSGVGTPLILQDAPGLTGTAMPVSWLAAQLERKEVVGAKIEASPSLAKIQQLRDAAPTASIFGGGGGLMYPEEFSRGAGGCMPGPAGCSAFVETHRRLTAGEEPESFWNLVPVLRYMMLGMDLFIWAQKTLLVRAGIIESAACRMPLSTIDERSTDELLRLVPGFPL